MGRRYTAVFQAVAVTAAQDLLSLLAPAGTKLKLISCRIGQSTDFGDAQAENLRIRIRRGMTTVGSGGTAPAMIPVDPSDGAAVAVARANDTTPASGGTIVECFEETFNAQIGWVYLPVPEERIECAVSTRIAVNLVAAPADSLTMSGTICWEEY